MNRQILVKTVRRLSFGLCGVLLGAAIAWSWLYPRDLARAATRQVHGRLAPELVGSEWLNAPKNARTALASRRGKVTVIEFWSAENLNSRANLPVYARWQKQFGAQGVTVIGVHTPASAQERPSATVARAVKAQAISYPVLLDSSGENWKRWNVRFWPTLYIVDGQNRVRARWVGQIGMREKELTQTIAALVNEGSHGVKPGTSAAMSHVVKTDAEWRKSLTSEQYEVLRNHGTEEAFSGDYQSHGDGVYVCAGCGQQLFSADTKFDSGTGWPSFYSSIEPGAVEEKRDMSYGMVRTEVLCSRCQGHLGHVFDDGPRPTGLRYCMNSVAMRFEKDGAATKK